MRRLSVQERTPPLALRDAGGAILGRGLRPLRNLTEAELVFGGIAADGDGEFGRGTGSERTYIILLRHRNRNGFIQALGVDIDTMRTPSESVNETRQREPAMPTSILQDSPFVLHHLQTTLSLRYAESDSSGGSH
jgi:hypothetical protein